MLTPLMASPCSCRPMLTSLTRSECLTGIDLSINADISGMDLATIASTQLGLRGSTGNVFNAILLVCELPMVADVDDYNLLASPVASLGTW